MENATPTLFYRYESFLNEQKSIFKNTPNVRVKEIVFKLVKETPKGYYITQHYESQPSLESEKIWVPKISKKRYAYPTKEEALFYFIKRKQRYEKILSFKVAVCEEEILEAQKLLTKLSNDTAISNSI